MEIASMRYLDIRQAILDRRHIRIDYTVGVSIVEPHAYGRSADGFELLRAFQIDGPHK